MIVVVTTIVDRRPAVADILQIDVARVEAVEFCDHGAPSAEYWWVCSPSRRFWQADGGRGWIFNPWRAKPSPMLLLIPGPVTTRPEVRAALGVDIAPWDFDFRPIYAGVRHRLLRIANGAERRARRTAVARLWTFRHRGGDPQFPSAWRADC